MLSSGKEQVMYTILGAGGSVSNEFVKLLAARNLPFRTVSRHAATSPGAAESKAADLTKHEQTLEAVAGSEVVFLLVGLKYDHKAWAEQWPRIIDNTVDACKRAKAKLVFFDNVYMYGKVNGPMTESTPYNPVSRKGEVRAQIATSLEKEWKSGELTAMIARSADFYGPASKNGIANALVFEPFSTRTRTFPMQPMHCLSSPRHRPHGTRCGICPPRLSLPLEGNSFWLLLKRWAFRRNTAFFRDSW
jgi:hypothetical protein